MTPETSEDAKAQQREVQRLLGRCMMKLQLYERLLKALIVDHEFAGPVQDHAAIQAGRKSRTGRQTLGTLVGAFLGSYLVAGDPPELPDADDDDGRASMSLRFQISLSPEDHAQTARDLKELVDLRNMLVHHFVDQHDLWTAQGCRRAQSALVEAYESIDGHFGRLVDIAKSHDAMRKAVVEALQSEAVREGLIVGTHLPNLPKT